MRSTLPSNVFDRVLSFTGFDFQLPFNTSKSGLSPTLTPSLQQVIHDYAERAAVWLEPNPLERVYHPPMNQAALEDFGRWCQHCCPGDCGWPCLQVPVGAMRLLHLILVAACTLCDRGRVFSPKKEHTYTYTIEFRSRCVGRTLFRHTFLFF